MKKLIITVLIMGFAQGSFGAGDGQPPSKKQRTDGGAGAGANIIQLTINSPTEDSFSNFNGLINVEGRKIEISCTGNGSTSIVLQSGSGNDLSTWGKVQPELSKRFRVCSYSRAGLGKSEKTEKSQFAREVNLELHSLLDKPETGIKKPFVLVGQSFGAIYSRFYQLSYPNEVLGMVLVDPAIEDDPGVTLLPDSTNLDLQQTQGKISAFVEAERQRLEGIAGKDDQDEKIWNYLNELAKQEPNASDINSIKDSPYPLPTEVVGEALRQAQIENNDQQEMLSKMDSNPHPLGNKPLVVLTSPADRLTPLVAAYRELQYLLRETISDDQKDIFDHFVATTNEKSTAINNEIIRKRIEQCNLSSHCKHIVAENSGHYIQKDEPHLVIEAINYTVESAMAQKDEL